MLKLIAKLFGTKSDKDIKRVMPLVEETKREGEKLLSISNDELRKKTFEIQAEINAFLKPIDDQLAGLHQQIAEQLTLDINEKETIFAQIDIDSHDLDAFDANTEREVRVVADWLAHQYAAHRKAANV